MTLLHRIVASFGGALLDGGNKALIPGPGHSRKDRSVSISLTEDGRLLIYCFGPNDDWRDVRDMLAAHDLLPESAAVSGRIPPVPDEVRPPYQDKIARARSIWHESLPIHGAPAERYLRNRAIAVSPLAATLRFHPRMTSLDDRLRRPAMIAAIADVQDQIQGVHITLLAPGGESKADVATPRRVVGRLLRGSVRLDDAVHPTELIVAEGLETALSASEALCLPAWAALSASALPRMHIPDSVRKLVIAADRGQAGEDAAAMLRTALMRRHIEIDIRFAPDGLQDWNDWARRTP